MMPTDIKGTRFGRLTAMYATDRRVAKGNVVWHCRCDCGNEIEVSYNSLAYCNMKSCGCLKKEHYQKLQTFLTHVSGTSVDILKSQKIPKDNTTGVRGVYLVRGKYIAKIVFQKKQYYLGKYNTAAEAAEARKEAEEVLFSETLSFYEKWKVFAAKDPQWAKDNPIEITVSRENGRLKIHFSPEITL